MSRKMRGQRRTSTEVEHCRKTFAALHLAGNSQAVIVEQAGLHQIRISKQLAVIRKCWKAASLIDFDERQAAELEKINKLKIEYLEGYECSKNKKTTVTTRKILVHVDENGYLIVNNRQDPNSEIVTETSVKEEERDGDPKWLDGVFYGIK